MGRHDGHLRAPALSYARAMRQTTWAGVFAVCTLLAALVVGCRAEKASPAPPAASPSAATTTPAPPPSAAPSAAPANSAAGDATATTTAQAWQHPFLWKVTPHGAPAGATASYLVGTIHIPDSRLAAFPPALEAAVKGADVVLTEIPMDSKTQMSVMGQVVLPPGQTLSKIVPAPLLARTKAAFDEKGVPFQAMSHVKVWAIAAQIAMLDHLTDMMNGKPLDARIYARAQDEKKEVGGIETVSEQMAVFDGLTTKEQVRVLEQALDERDKAKKEHKDEVHDLIEAYVKGDATPLLALLNAGFDKSKPLDVKLYRRLVTNRNAVMAKRFAARLKAQPKRSFLLAVGAAHLLGDDGSVVSLLKKAGYDVERM